MRALVLVVAVFASGCAAVPDSFACAHCACTAAQRSVQAPVLCATVRHETECCTPVVLPTS